MQLPFFTPMFDSRVDILGVPQGVLVVAGGVLLLVAGCVWTLRISRGDGEYRSFRATAVRSSRLPAVGLLLLVVAAALSLLFR